MTRTIRITIARLQLLPLVGALLAYGACADNDEKPDNACDDCRQGRQHEHGWHGQQGVATRPTAVGEPTGSGGVEPEVAAPPPPARPAIASRCTRWPSWCFGPRIDHHVRQPVRLAQHFRDRRKKAYEFPGGADIATRDGKLFVSRRRKPAHSPLRRRRERQAHRRSHHLVRQLRVGGSRLTRQRVHQLDQVVPEHRHPASRSSGTRRRWKSRARSRCRT